MRKVSLLIIAAAFFAVSCKDETTIFKDQLQDEVSLEQNDAILKGSISFDDAGVLDILEEQEISGKTAKGMQQAGDYPLTLVAQIDAPSFTGAENLGATHIHLDGDVAYVSYNTVEDGYAGAIDIMNVADPNRPALTGRLYYSNADINSIAYDNGFVYAAGGFDSEQSTRTDFNSFVAKIPVENGRFNLSAGINYGFQEGFNATDVKVRGNEVLVASGGDGFITAYSKNDLTSLYDAPFADLRSIGLVGNEVAVLDASEGVKMLDQNFNVLSTVNINADFGEFSKRTIDISNNRLVVSEGAEGAGVYEANSGNYIKHLPILVNPDGVASQNIVTNAVSINEDVILMANGGAGLSLSEDQGANPDLVGIIELNGSINFVVSKGDYIFAASGKRGLQIIKMNKPSSSLEAECASSPAYTGGRNLIVDAGQDLEYSGSRRFNSLDISGNLLLCGSWTVRNDVSISDNALFEMNGSLVVGRNRSRKDVKVGSGATFRVEGSLIIYGDLILNEGSTIEFLGDNSSANIFGNVIKGDNVTVTGNFDDVRNKF
jgi:hypothetical protein